MAKTGSAALLVLLILAGCGLDTTTGASRCTKPDTMAVNGGGVAVIRVCQ